MRIKMPERASPLRLVLRLCVSSFREPINGGKHTPVGGAKGSRRLGGLQAQEQLRWLGAGDGGSDGRGACRRRVQRLGDGHRGPAAGLATGMEGREVGGPLVGRGHVTGFRSDPSSPRVAHHAVCRCGHDPTCVRCRLVADTGTDVRRQPALETSPQDARGAGCSFFLT